MSSGTVDKIKLVGDNRLKREGKVDRLVGNAKDIAEKVVDTAERRERTLSPLLALRRSMMMRSCLPVVSFAALALAGIAIAADITIVAREKLQKIVAVRDVRVQPDEVSGVLVNLSSNPVRNVKVEIDRSWLWKNERHPGLDQDNPGRSVVYAVPGEVPPGGSLPFTYRSDNAPTQRSDGSFETSVSVVSLEQAG